MSAEGDSAPADNQSHTGDQCPQKQEEPPQPSEPPAVPEDNKEETEMQQERDKSQLSSSVIVEVPNVQSSLELSTIKGNGPNVDLWFSGNFLFTLMACDEAARLCSLVWKLISDRLRGTGFHSHRWMICSYYKLKKAFLKCSSKALSKDAVIGTCLISYLSHLIYIVASRDNAF